MPKISIITPTYNSSKTISQTVKAILNQSFTDFEYIIIDGASKDTTIEVLEGFIPEFEQKGVAVTIVSERDKGVYDAMNKGITLAKGELIGITNSDDWYEDTALELMWDKFRKLEIDKQNCMLYGIERQWKDDKVYMVHRRGADFVAEGTLPHATFFVAKKVYEKYGYFDLSVKVLADYDFYCRCITQGVEIHGIDSVISNFRLGGLSSSYFAYYEDFHMLQYKYGFISERRYKEIMLVLRLKKIINKVIKRW